MPTPNLQKACVACTLSKRRCDRQLPGCYRCLDKEIECVYPPSRRRRRLHRPGTEEPQHARTDVADQAPNLWNGLDAIEWDGMAGSALGMQLALPSLQLPTLSAPKLVVPNVDTPEESQRPASSRGNTRWFLDPETWALENPRSHSPTTVAPLLTIRTFMAGVQAMLREWIAKGSNGFIHTNLYPMGLPMCLQEAFTTLSAYISRTPATEDLILQIAEDRAVALIARPLPSEDLQTNLIAHLSRVQALFVYQVIRLLNGCVRHRALAEVQIPVLSDWSSQLFHAATAYQATLQVSRDRTEGYTGPHTSTAGLWKIWILTESVRRTWIVVCFVLTVYLFMKEGWVECAGSVMVTARKGFWEASTAAQWLRLCQSQDPWMVNVGSGEALFTEDQAESVDEFTSLMWTVVSADDRAQCWIDISRSRLDMLAL